MFIEHRQRGGGYLGTDQAPFLADLFTVLEKTAEITKRGRRGQHEIELRSPVPHLDLGELERR